MNIEEIVKKRGFVIFYDNRTDDFTTDEYQGNTRLPEFYVELHRKVHVERMTGDHPDIRQALQRLIQIVPNLIDASLRFDNNPKITLREFLSEDMGDTMLYHGTSTSLLGRIASDGLTPRENREAHNFSARSGESLDDRVYFSSSSCLGHARFAAESATKKHGGTPVILEVALSSLLSESKLMPDEDSREKDWQGSLFKLGACAYQGVVEPEHIQIAGHKNQMQAFLDHPRKLAIMAAFDQKKNFAPLPIQQQNSLEI